MTSEDCRRASRLIRKLQKIHCLNNPRCLGCPANTSRGIDTPVCALEVADTVIRDEEEIALDLEIYMWEKRVLSIPDPLILRVFDFLENKLRKTKNIKEWFK